MSGDNLALFGNDLFGEPVKPPSSGQLADEFIVPPFSVLNAREGGWQERKRAWLSMGIKGEMGRHGDTFSNKWAKEHDISGCGSTMADDYISVFDPVLCELAYSWFCPPAGSVLDPFAGGSVRGIVAQLMGHPYHGIELSAEQVAANRAQAETICPDDRPTWTVGDACAALVDVPDSSVDFVFSCPPYADLERYSDDPRDLSTMGYRRFLAAYRHIVSQSCAKLRDHRLACFVVGDVRDKRGHYRNFVGDTIDAFRDAGMELYNEAILVTAVGSLAMRIRRQFNGGRKLGKAHQNVLVFVKGDWRKLPKGTP